MILTLVYLQQGQPTGMNGCSPLLMAGGGQMGDMGIPAPLHIMTTMGPPTKVMVSLVSDASWKREACVVYILF